MKERPILFSTPMVQAILAGSKTQTRRICKPANTESLSFVVSDNGHFGDEEGDVSFTCPYGKPGERLWVRETWRVNSKATDLACVVYRASENDSWTNFHKYFPVALAKDQKAMPAGWKPSIFMPRWASRILLEITDIRVERLNDISEEDAKNEGLIKNSLFGEWGGVVKHPTVPDHFRWFRSPINAFKNLWESINGEESWDKTPWVWVVEFKVIEGQQS